ncbi:MAG: TorF family putative porin [Gammaproteobacteria bacterium]|nr:TorF family putative porin [Gammaproteobacteria bacterium]
MKASIKTLIVTSVLIAGVAHADFSANIGFASDYYYRGIFQADSSANGGIDYESGGFYAGAWAADVKDGLEVDGYFGYGGEIEDFAYSVGYTGYFYSGEFDDTYQEINLGGSYGLLALDVAIGQYENFSGPTQDYTYYSLTIEKDGFHGRLAGFSQDFSGEYLELGYSTSAADIDLGVNLLFNDEDLSGDGNSDQALIFTVGKSFDLN